MDAEEFARIELLHQGLQGFAHVVDFARNVEAGVVSFSLDPVDVGYGHEEDTATVGNGEALRVVRLQAGIEEGKQALCRIFILTSKAAFSSAR